MDVNDAEQENRVYRRFLNESQKRLKRRGVSEEVAGRVAREVAERALKRMRPPDYRNEHEFAAIVARVCGRLCEGLSYYRLVAEMPFLATARIDRLVGLALRTNPPLDVRTAAAARRAVRVEKMSGGVALLFAGLALGTLGLWYAMGVGVVIGILGEIYAQVFMPAMARRVVADLWFPPLVLAAAAAVTIYFGYRWVEAGDVPTALILLAVVALLVITFVVPGLTLAVLVGRRERKRRKAIEDQLLD